MKTPPIVTLRRMLLESRRTDEFGNQFQFRAKVNPGDRKDQTEPPVARWAYDVFLATD